MRRHLPLGAFACALLACGSLLSLGASDDPAPPPPRDDAGTRGADGPSGLPDGGASVDASDPSAADADAAARHYVFLLSAFFPGTDLYADGGSPDVVCQAQADKFPLLAGRRFVAWLALDGQSASARLQEHGPWHTVLGQLVAANKAALTSGANLSHAIDSTEDGGAPGNGCVWTGTKANGTLGMTCSNWTPAGGNGTAGTHRSFDATWTDSPLVPGCTSSCRLYCFEQPVQ